MERSVWKLLGIEVSLQGAVFEIEEEDEGRQNILRVSSSRMVRWLGRVDVERWEVETKFQLRILKEEIQWEISKWQDSIKEVGCEMCSFGPD